MVPVGVVVAVRRTGSSRITISSVLLVGEAGLPVRIAIGEVGGWLVRVHSASLGVRLLVLEELHPGTFGSNGS